MNNVNNQNFEKLNNANNNYQQNQVSNNSNLNLLQFFIGDNYNKISIRKFSFAGALFGGLYFVYRKMYLVGILLYFLQCFLISLNLNMYILISISLIMMILMGIFTNKIYLNYAKKMVNKIISENPSRNQNDLSMICVKKGGKNGIFKVLLIAIIVSIGTNFMISNLNLK